ncbi:MAG: amino acid adenylation domain-containing protein, partial [Phormidium sp.]
IDNTQVYILDKNRQIVPIGVPGELYIGGAGLAREYHNRPELTAEKFITNPFSKQANSRLYKTGDLVRYLPDGNIEYLGRTDNQVKIRGFRIELGEIEALLQQHPQVQTSVVITHEENTGDKRLVVYVVSEIEATSIIGELRQYLKAKLPGYMIPNAFVVLETLPLTPNGKVDRRALPKPHFYSETKDKYVAPRTPIEEILAIEWGQVLNLKRVGIHDNFFALGGHSLLATQLMSRIRRFMQVELPLRCLFEAPTVGELAKEIQQIQQQNLHLSLPPILKRENNQDLLLSYAQTRLWFIDQFEPNSALYNIPVALRLQGKLEVTALEQSLETIIGRHEALRTNFMIVEEEPTQIIHAISNWKLSVVELEHLSTSEREVAIQELLQQQAIAPFDLAKDLLIRTTLVTLSETEHILSMCMHHIVSDGWSMGVFVSELAVLYNAYAQGFDRSADSHGSLNWAESQPSPLSPLAIQYADFALWQREWLQGEVLQNQLSYWKEQLADAPALLSLPTDRSRKAVQTFVGAHQEFVLTPELTQGLTQLSQEQGVTLFMTLLAGFKTLLYRYTGQLDIVVGTPIANRNHSEIEGLIGFFVNTLVLRTHLAKDLNFTELLKQVREVSLAAYTHQDLPFEMLVEALQPQRDLSYSPLFQVMFVLQNASVSQFELSGLTISSIEVESALAKFDLTLSMENTPTGLVGLWEYNTDLFDGDTIERMTGHFLTLLSAIVANPQEQISQLPLLTEVEQQQLIEWHHTQVDYPLDKCIHQLFEEQVEQTPEAVAVVYESEQLTYRELNCRANQLAHYLRLLGVGADVLVGICLERSIEMAIGLLAILKAGGAYLPLDPEYPTERLSFMLKDTQVQVLLTQEKLVASFPKHQAQVVCLDSHWQTINQANQDNLNNTVSSENLAYVIYTSGSTGIPKGVVVTHQAVNRLVLNTNYIDLTANDCIAQAANIAFDAATFEIWGALLNGGKIVIINKSVLLSPSELAASLRANQISVLFLTTALFNQLASAEPQAFSGLRCLLFGGEAVDPLWVKEVLDKGAPQKLLHVYGPTENTTFSSWYLVEKLAPEASTVPIGRAIANTQIYVLDQNLQLVPVGVPGELHIGGIGLAKGYLNRPELTAQKFIPNPFINDVRAGLVENLCDPEKTCEQNPPRLYKTGDLVRYLPDGNIEYLGRIDNQVKIRGFRIELGEIESILNQHPQVQVAVAIAREDIPTDKRLVAYIIPQPEATLSTSQLRQHLKAFLPEYMIPSAIVFLETLPLTPNGKIDRRALPKPESRTGIHSSIVAPRTQTEETLVQ